MILNHFKKLLGSWLNSRVGHKHNFYQFGHQVGISDVVLVTQHHNEEHHNILSTGLIEHLRRVPAERGEAQNKALGHSTWVAAGVSKQGERQRGLGAESQLPLTC